MEWPDRWEVVLLDSLLYISGKNCVERSRAVRSHNFTIARSLRAYLAYLAGVGRVRMLASLVQRDQMCAKQFTVNRMRS